MKQTIDSEDLLAVFERSTNPACVLEPVLKSGRIADLRIVAFNAAFKRLLRLEQVALEPGLLVSEASLQDSGAILSVARQVVARGRPRTLRLYFAALGQWRRCTFAMSGTGRVVAVLTELESAAAAKLVRSPMLMRDFFDSPGIKLVLRASDGRILACNRDACEFYGWPPERFKALTIDRITSSPAEVIERRTRAIEARGLLIFHTNHRLASGELRAVEVHSYFSVLQGEKVHVCMVIACDPASVGSDESGSGRERPMSERHFTAFVSRHERAMPFVGELVRQILPYGRLIEYRRGEHFLEYGDVSDNAGFLLDGMFRLYTLLDEGKDCTLKMVRPGEIIYEAPGAVESAFFDLALEALETCRVFVINAAHFGPVIDADLRWSKLFYRLGIESADWHQRREASLLSEDATRRYERFAREEADALGLLRSYDAASYLGITAETLSRIRGASHKDPLAHRRRDPIDKYQ